MKKKFTLNVILIYQSVYGEVEKYGVKFKKSFEKAKAVRDRSIQKEHIVKNVQIFYFSLFFLSIENSNLIF